MFLERVLNKTRCFFLEYSESTVDLKGGPRIDPKFVNNPDLSDIQFRVEGNAMVELIYVRHGSSP